MRITQAAAYPEPRDSISHDWIRRLDAWGMTPAPVPNALADAPGYLAALAPGLLILTGGDDLGATQLRDTVETALLNHACVAGIPVLGVCRGLQLINVNFGGWLGPVEGHIARPHTVTLAGPWQALYGDETLVNSYHAAGIPADGLAPGLTATARDRAGAVEGAVHQSLPVAGVMWHPERGGAPDGDHALINALIAGTGFRA